MSGDFMTRVADAALGVRENERLAQQEKRAREGRSVKLQIQIMPDGTVNVMDEEFEPIPTLRAEISEAAEGQTWVDIEGELP